MSNLIIKGALENGDGAVELTVATDGSVTAPPGKDNTNTPPSTVDLASKLAGTGLTASAGKLNAAGGGGGDPRTLFGQPVRNYSSSNAARQQTYCVPASKISKGRLHWTNNSHNGTLQLQVFNQRTSTALTVVLATSASSGFASDSGSVTPMVCQAGDLIDINITDGDSDDSADGTNIWWSLDVAAP